MFSVKRENRVHDVVLPAERNGDVRAPDPRCVAVLESGHADPLLRTGADSFFLSPASTHHQPARLPCMQPADRCWLRGSLWCAATMFYEHDSGVACFDSFLSLPAGPAGTTQELVSTPAGSPESEYAKNRQAMLHMVDVFKAQYDGARTGMPNPWTLRHYSQFRLAVV